MYIIPTSSLKRALQYTAHPHSVGDGGLFVIYSWRQRRSDKVSMCCSCSTLRICCVLWCNLAGDIVRCRVFLRETWGSFAGDVGLFSAGKRGLYLFVAAALFR